MPLLVVALPLELRWRSVPDRRPVGIAQGPVLLPPRSTDVLEHQVVELLHGVLQST